MPRPRDYAGNWIQRGLRWGVDAALPGAQRAPDGTLNNKAVALGLGAAVGGAVAMPYIGPLASLAIKRASGPVVDFASGQGGAIEKAKQWVQALASGRGKNPAGLTIADFGGDTSLDVSNIAQQIGINPQLQMGGGNASPADRMAAELQKIQDRINTTNLPAVNVGRSIGGQLAFGGGRGGYNNGAGAGTGFGAANYTNDAWGDTAMGFGVGGMSGGARDQAMSVYGPSGRKTRI